MLIVSKEHDYYDTAHDGFIDKTIVYQRTPVQVNAHLKNPYDYFGRNSRGKKINIQFPSVGYCSDRLEHKDLFIVGFCGKFYIGLHHHKSSSEVSFDRYIYNFDEIISCLGLKPEKKSKSSWSWNQGYTGFVDFWNKYNGVEYPELFLEYKVPIFYIGKDRKILTENYDNNNFVLNPTLKYIEFYKVIDSKTAFIAIQTYISNILTNPEKDSFISNKDKIESHGFDYKTSFRKDPTKPWKKRK